MDRRSGRTRQRYGRFRSRSWRRLARYRLATGDADEAARDAHQALRLVPPDHPALVAEIALTAARQSATGTTTRQARRVVRLVHAVSRHVQYVRCGKSSGSPSATARTARSGPRSCAPLGRGLGGVQLVISDAHTGLNQAIAGVLLGAAGQRRWVHFLRNVLAQVPKGNAEMVAAADLLAFAGFPPWHWKKNWPTTRWSG